MLSMSRKRYHGRVHHHEGPEAAAARAPEVPATIVGCLDDVGRARSVKSMGIASSGKQGRAHLFSVLFEDCHSEILTVTQLRARFAADSKPAPGARAVTNTLLPGELRFPRKLSPTRVRSYSGRDTPVGCHDITRAH